MMLLHCIRSLASATQDAMSLRSLGANDNLLYLNLVNPKKLPNRNSELHTPLRNTRLIRVTTGGGALAKNSDNSRVVVVGKECQYSQSTARYSLIPVQL